MQQKKAQVFNRYITQTREVIKNDPALLDELKRLKEEKFNDDPTIIVVPNNIPDDGINKGEAGTKGDARAYYGSIYRIIVERITIEDRNGNSYPSNLSTNKIDCGSGFVTPNGTFVTARQNIQPWIYVDGNTPADNWRKRLAVLVALGNDVNIEYSAYSTDGPAARLQFNSRDFSMPTGGDVVTSHVKITEEEWTYFEKLGLTYSIDKKQIIREGIDIQHAASSARAYATLPGTGRVGIPIDAGTSNSIAGGSSLGIVYYGTSNVQNLAGAAQYYTATTTTADNKGGTIHLQSSPSSTAFGAPAFIREPDGSLMVVGVFVGRHQYLTFSCGVCRLRSDEESTVSA